MTTSSIWDQPAMQVADNFVTFTAPGDTVTGKVQAVLAHTFADGSVAPQLVLDVGGETKTVTCGAIRLKATMAEKRPDVGDTVTITLEREEPRGGGKTLRHWVVDVVRAGGTAPAAAPQAAPAASAPAGQTPEQAAALANLTPEQKAALGL